MREICLVRAPSNLGLRPLRPGHIPGTWRAPQALTEAGLIETLTPLIVVDLDRPAYSTEPQPGTRLRNGNAIRSFNLGLAEVVAGALRRGEFPLVVGGDCAVLLGALAGAGDLVRWHWSMSMATAISAIRAITTSMLHSARPPAWTLRSPPDVVSRC